MFKQTLATAMLCVLMPPGSLAAAQEQTSPSTQSGSELQLTNAMQATALLQVIEQRGLECGLLSKWRAATLRAQILDAMSEWNTDKRDAAAAHTQTLAAQTGCDAALLTNWISMASRGFDSEYLPPYLIIYRTLAMMETRPAVFEAAALRYRFAPAIAAIDAKIAALEAEGRVPDGGGSWPDFVAKTSNHTRSLAVTLNGEADDARYSADQAAAFFAQAALITELWLEEALSSSQRAQEGNAND